MPYEIMESKLLFQHHALSGYVSMLALTHTLRYDLDCLTTVEGILF